jgi:uncharacterized protein YjbJ (UPF0337 family)
MRWTQQRTQWKRQQDELVGAIQQRYGTLQQVAQKQMDEWRAKLSTRPREKHH